jgi:hypothetical protein
MKFDQYLADPNLTAFEKNAMVDYWVTDAEYQKAVNLFSQCMKDKGYIVSYSTLTDQYTYTQRSDMVAMDVGDAIAACQVGTTLHLEPLYELERHNPDVLQQWQLIQACYTKNDVPDGKGMSSEQFQQMINDVSYCPNTPSAKLCFMDPTGQFGITQQQADQQACQMNKTRRDYTLEPSAPPS